MPTSATRPGGAALPVFRYHPDPLGTGSVERDPSACDACGEVRGYVYRGPIFAIDEVGTICPWCIADGSAAARFDATFTDIGFGVPPDVPSVVTETVASRTPGFYGWQQEHWLYHCGDAGAFLGRAGRAEIHADSDAYSAVAAEPMRKGIPPGSIAAYMSALSTSASPTAYIFRCLHCGTHVGYSDSL